MQIFVYLTGPLHIFALHIFVYILFFLYFYGIPVCANVCVSAAIHFFTLFSFDLLCLLCPSLIICFLLSYYYSLDTCFHSEFWKRVDSDGRGGWGSWKSWGREILIQNLLYKKSNFNKRKKTSRTLHLIQFRIIHATIGNSMGTSAKSVNIWFSEASIMLLAVVGTYTNDSLRTW